MTFEEFLIYATVFATATLAVSGIIQAARCDMDIFGGGVLALVCALGGGTLRDLLIGASPVFWITDLLYLSVILVTTVLTAWLLRFVPVGRGLRFAMLDVADAFGLALFAILGAQKALSFGLSEPIAVVMGVMTGVAGGIIRDVITQQQPAVMRGDSFYATAGIIGCVVYCALEGVLTETVSMLVGMTVILVLRLAAIRWKFKIPSLIKPGS
ncbi:MAG: trimeric intracellular cation channel family protein [Pseudomonadota bacterium]